MNKYEELGFKDRKEYLQDLALDYGVPYEVVLELADVLGEQEDFDGLVSELSDLEWDEWFDEEEDEE